MNSFTVERNNYRRKLISLVKQHPILWDKNLENNKRNRPEKNMAWDEISKQLEVDTDTLRRTWENLRDQYRRDLKREMTYGLKSKWRFFNEMNFMREMIAPKGIEIKTHLDSAESDTEVDNNEPSHHDKLPNLPEINSTLATANSSQTLTSDSNIKAQTTNNLRFQPIVLTRQWQPPASETSQQYKPLTAANSSYTRKGLEVQANYDSTDSDTQVESNDNKQHLNHDELLSAPEITTTLASANLSQTLAPASNIVAQTTNILPFQPMVLIRQWPSPVRKISQQCNPLTAEVSSHTPSVPIPQHIPNPSEVQNNCDSSNENLKQTINQTNPSLFEVIKQENPDFDVIVNEDTQPKAAPGTTSSANVLPNPNPREIQEDCVSTSSHKRARTSLEEISECHTNVSTSSAGGRNETDLELRDDDYYFVLSLLPSLREISRNQKFPLRLDLMNVIAKYLKTMSKD